MKTTTKRENKSNKSFKTGPTSSPLTPPQRRPTTTSTSRSPKSTPTPGPLINTPTPSSVKTKELGPSSPPYRSRTSTKSETPRTPPSMSGLMSMERTLRTQPALWLLTRITLWPLPSLTWSLNSRREISWDSELDLLPLTGTWTPLSPPGKPPLESLLQLLSPAWPRSSEGNNYYFTFII